MCVYIFKCMDCKCLAAGLLPKKKAPLPSKLAT